MKRLLLLALACAAVLSTPAAAAAIKAKVTVLQEMGPPESRIDLLFVAEGYRAIDQQQLRQDADWLMTSLLSVEPWSLYPELVNVKLLEVASNERGADRGSYGEEVDTAFDAHFYCGGTERSLCLDNVKVLAAAAQHAPEFDYVIAIVNDPKYGGSGGVIAAVSINPLSTHIVAHEVGHQVAGLADEYETPNPDHPLCSEVHDCSQPNVTLRTTLEELKWAAWVEPLMPIPSPPGHPGVGLFEGARYFATGIYRPHQNCKMRSSSADFCPVCKEAHVLALFVHGRLIENPTSTPVSPGSCDDELVFRVDPVVDPDTLTFAWSINGLLLGEQGPELRLPRSALPQFGLNHVLVQVEHETELVKTGRVSDGQRFEALGSDCQNPCVSGIRCTPYACSPTFEPDGTTCGDPICEDGLAERHICLAGACVDEVRNCAPYLCGSDLACAKHCSDDAGCIAGWYCLEGKETCERENIPPPRY